jgi:AraC-like DNA-binding protein
LAATNISVKEIAYDLGFRDDNYFCRQFKHFAGQTPLSYREDQV